MLRVGSEHGPAVTPNGVQQLVQVLGRRERIDDRRPHRANAVDLCRHDVEFARFDHATAQFQLELAQLLPRSLDELIRHVAEHDDIALRFVDGFEVGSRLQFLVECLAQSRT